ncbi:class I SAM-dependent methyltransferase [Thermithiobacillus plumbiphilus]|uniref:SAM-dependent methyltransferase n=1 Tax=Thermithiobacillus plumbiphilus TaxID=1729899 RepID=A0ABU9DBR6_9PROT
MSDQPHCPSSNDPVNLRKPPVLPEPSDDELAHAAALTDRIRAEIQQQGGILPFRRFMEMALYAPGLGYYVAGQQRFGAGGDFVTAPELGDVFARTLAHTVAAALWQGGDMILEFGAGSGVLAADLLLALEHLGLAPAEYAILELSPDLRVRQQETLARKAPRLAERVRWLDRLPDTFSGVVIANEVLDAMPVHLIETDADGGLWEKAVRWSGEGFAWDRLAPGELLRERWTDLGAGLPTPYQTEINLAAQAWVQALAERLHSGVLLLVDYGFLTGEYYHPQRNMGTLMCHYRHHAHGDPLKYPGLQDITAHVDFSAVAKAGQAAGLDVLGFATQAQFLMDAGLQSVLMESLSADPAVQLALANQVKRLTLPGEMGEMFKVLALGRRMPGPLPGFGRGLAGAF